MHPSLVALKRRLSRMKRKLFAPKAHVLKLIEAGMVCGEIGVWKGAFSQKTLLRHPGKLHLIDPWLYLPEYNDRVYGKRGNNSQEKMDKVYNEVVELFKNTPNVVIHRLTSQQAISKFGDDYFDFIYIDGNHSYEFVKKDLELYIPKVKRGGYITGDDYISRHCPHGGPKKAVSEILSTKGIELLSVKNNQYVLRRL